MADGFPSDRVRNADDAIAARYAATFGNELDELPLDRALVDRLGALAGDGMVLEAGAGVAPVARHLLDCAVVACDLSSEMMAFAPPAAGRVQADIRRLPFRTGSFAAAVARYVLQHVPRADAPLALAELRRVLADGGHLLVAVHLGEGEVEFDELLGQRFKPVVVAFHRRDELHELLSATGFTVVEEATRGPVHHEGNSERLYVVAVAGAAPATTAR